MPWRRDWRLVARSVIPTSQPGSSTISPRSWEPKGCVSRARITGGVNQIVEAFRQAADEEITCAPTSLRIGASGGKILTIKLSRFFALVRRMSNES